ncbi:hypothetical protein [Sinorhizobium medicae]|uniref:Helix-turn-helix domain-containing protein n=1 Tax=Sinorhizobium medicae TaxID=110321 RepID=A0ABX4TFL4_9HYPH|nr:hypothetical protein [Sinorhizobium medicae]PLT97183.1 hypothetical protein BMJ33_26360 [Sinorhizobium medicae]PLU23635.1 hypothetical protein BMJ29_04500 [Sinorhizobium medicae]PLU79519.1 hypothetical protein BMJ19_12485 [Sinorhizobium medicae]
MSAPLIPTTTTKQADISLSRSELVHQQRVARAKAMDGALNDINRGKSPAPGASTRSSSGIESILIVDDASAPMVKAAKPAAVDLHRRVKVLEVALSPDAAKLLSLVLRADEAYRGAQLIDLSAFTVKNALGVSENEAIAARSELECHGLIIFHDNGSGHRGFYPRLP